MIQSPPIPLGTSEPQDFQLLDGGLPLVGTGLDVALVITATDGSTIGSPVLTVAWLSQATGTVRVTGVEQLALGSYSVRFSLTDGAGHIGYAPNGDTADVWDVVPVVP